MNDDKEDEARAVADLAYFLRQGLKESEVPLSVAAGALSWILCEVSKDMNLSRHAAVDRFVTVSKLVYEQQRRTLS